MTFLRILLFTLTLLVVRGPRELAYREEIAVAVVTVTDDLVEQGTLARIARWESDYRRDVGECRVRGAAGELGLWQVKARTPEERVALCGDLVASARIALARVRESVRACGHLRGSDVLSGYTVGRCVVGEPKARLRWGAP